MRLGFKIAIAGNPNCGKTTLFNALTGFNQFVGNWPGVTVEKKEGRLLKHHEVTVTDLPGIYSLSPYTMEEIVARNYLTTDHPDVILNIIDGTNLERNLYLTTQLKELNIPMVIAVNLADVMEKNNDILDTALLAKKLGCPVFMISALKKTGLDDVIEACINADEQDEKTIFSQAVETVINQIGESAKDFIPKKQKRWFAVKIFERDKKAIAPLNIKPEISKKCENIIQAAEKNFDDDSESIITNERYAYITELLSSCYKKNSSAGLSASDKIDRVVTNRFLALPIFAAVMFLVYYISITTVGGWMTDWVNDNLFGDGWHMLGVGSVEYEEASEKYAEPKAIIEAFEKAAENAHIEPKDAKNLTAEAVIYDEDGEITEKIAVDYAKYTEASKQEEPDPAAFGMWIPGIPKLAGDFLEKIGCAKWLHDLIVDGIIAGVGAVLGFVPQMFVLFIFLAFLEACGYMARIAFIMDRVFRKFGLSGKSFIPMLIGTGCGVPGIMASRTIENDRDRKMTIITTTFIPCSAKLPIIALIAGALFDKSAWVAPSAYFVGVLAVIISGIMLKNTKLFAGDPAPFVMELPPYRWPTVGNVLRSMWERGSSFIKKAGTIILLATILVWFTSNFGWQDGKFGMTEMNDSILAYCGNAIAWLFIPLGWGFWQAAVASVTGLIAKENVVGTFGVLFGGFDEVAENGWQIWDNMRSVYTPLSAYSFLVFNLLCAPCFAAIGAIRREMNNAKWTLFAVGYQCLFAYAVSFCIYQIGTLLNGGGSILGGICSAVIIVFVIKMLFFTKVKLK